MTLMALLSSKTVSDKLLRKVHRAAKQALTDYQEKRLVNRSSLTHEQVLHVLNRLCELSGAPHDAG